MMNRNAYFDTFVEKYGDYEVHPEYEYLRILKETGILNESKDKKVLDAGCGTGAFTYRLANLGFNVTGIDISSRMIELAILKRGNKMNIEYVVGDIRKMPFECKTFDIVFCGAILHHLPSQLFECVTEFYRVLKPAGKVFFFEPHYFCINSLLRYHIFCIERTPQEKALNPEKLKQEFLKAGFVNFEHKKLTKIKCIYFATKNDILKRTVNCLRRIVNEYVFPNCFFVGSCVKP